MTDHYAKKIADLEAEINKLDAQMPTVPEEEKSIKYVPKSLSQLKYYLIGGGVAPLLYLAILYFSGPSFLYVTDNHKKKLSKKRLFLWVGILTLLTWVGIYLYLYVEV